MYFIAYNADITTLYYKLSHHLLQLVSCSSILMSSHNDNMHTWHDQISMNIWKVVETVSYMSIRAHILAFGSLFCHSFIYFFFLCTFAWNGSSIQMTKPAPPPSTNNNNNNIIHDIHQTDKWDDLFNIDDDWICDWLKIK